MKSILLAAALLSSGVAFAAPSAAPAAATETKVIDPAALAASERLIDAMDFDRTLRSMIDGLIVGQRGEFAKQLSTNENKKLPPELIERIYQVMERHLRSVFREEGPKMRRAMVLMYAENFTASELDRLAEIQRDPVMIKSIQVMPKIMSDAMTLSRGMFQKAQPTLKEEVVKMITDYYATDKL